MATEKKTKAEIIKSIINEVSKSSRSIYELSKTIGSNWDTIKSNVELLIELNILEFADQKVSIKKDCKISFKEDNIAGLPLSEDIKETTYALAGKINQEWIKQTGEIPSNTQLQKVMVDISELKEFSKLNIPRGWYFYGKIVLVKFDREKLATVLDRYDFKKHSINLKELENKIKEIVANLKDMSISELVAYQYKKYNKEDYLIKKEVERLFFTNNFDKKKFANLLYELIFKFKIIKEDALNHKVLSIMKEVISVMIKYSLNVNIEKNPEFKTQLLETFSTFWRLYATYQLFVTLEGDTGYEKRTIKDIFIEKINFYTSDLTDHFNNYMVIST